MNSSLRRGDIWWVRFDPSLGAEIKKCRPAVIVSSDAIGKLPLKLVAPITKWQTKFEASPWLVKIRKSVLNGLESDSAVDLLQMKSVMCNKERFQFPIGKVTPAQMTEIVTAVAIVVEYR